MESELDVNGFTRPLRVLQAINRKLADGSHGDVSELLRQMTISTECVVLQVRPRDTQGGKGWGCRGVAGARCCMAHRRSGRGWVSRCQVLREV